jgi:hypothetical protein
MGLNTQQPGRGDSLQLDLNRVRVRPILTRSARTAIACGTPGDSSIGVEPDRTVGLPVGTRVFTRGRCRRGTVMPHPPKYFPGQFPVRFDDRMIWEVLDTCVRRRAVHCPARERGV